MAGQGLRHLGIHPARHQPRDERVAQGVEISVAARAIDIGEKCIGLASRCVLRGPVRAGGHPTRLQPCCTGIGQIRAEHDDDLLRSWHVEGRGVGHLAGKVGFHRRRQIQPDRLHVLPPMF